jgi:hypothetical protein
MEQDINLIIEDFKGSLMSTINNCGLPISVIYYVMTDLYKEVDTQYYNYINQARAAASRQVEEAAPAPQPEIKEEKED